MSSYKVIESKRTKSNKFIGKALKQLESAFKSVELLREANNQEMEDAREKISEHQDFIEQKATANSMLQVELDKIKLSMVKLNEVLRDR